MIYLDANATTPLRKDVMAAMMPALADFFANPSSVHKPGQDARSLVDRAREECAAVLGCLPKEIVFTSGGTEADALAVHGLRPAKIVTTAVEHPAIHAACDERARLGAKVVRVPVGRDGELDLDLLARELEGASLCTVMAANNETGVIFPNAPIAGLCRDRGVPLHVDAVQAAGKLRLRDLGWDLLSLSAHKIGGPKGAGLLAVRAGLRLEAVQPGGHQEKGRRGGTENVAGIVGLGAALAACDRELETTVARLTVLRDRLEMAAAAIPGARIAGARAERVCNTLNAAFAGCDGETLLVALDGEGVAVSTGSACSSGTLEPSPVLLAMGYPPRLARGAVRFSLWAGNTAAEIDRVCELLPGIVRRATA